ncbi:hypothetical protein Ocin01_07617, partial [Orchesella cincta]
RLWQLLYKRASGSGRWVVGLGTSLSGCAPSFGPRVYERVATAATQKVFLHYYLNSRWGKEDLSNTLIFVLSKLIQTGEESLKLVENYLVKVVELQLLEALTPVLRVTTNGLILLAKLAYRQVSILIFAIATFSLLIYYNWVFQRLWNVVCLPETYKLHQDDYRELKDSCSEWMWVKDRRADKVDSSSTVNADGESCRRAFEHYSSLVSPISDKVLVERRIKKSVKSGSASASARYINSVSDLYATDEIDALLDEIRDLEPVNMTCDSRTSVHSWDSHALYHNNTVASAVSLCCLCYAGTAKYGLFMLPYVGRIRLMLFIILFSCLVTALLLFLDISLLYHAFPVHYHKWVSLVYFMNTLAPLCSSCITTFILYLSVEPIVSLRS